MSFRHTVIFTSQRFNPMEAAEETTVAGTLQEAEGSVRAYSLHSTRFSSQNGFDAAAATVVGEPLFRVKALPTQGPWTGFKPVSLGTPRSLSAHGSTVGNLTAHLLDWLHEAAGMQAAEVQVVGHSLGAHVAGAIGQNLKNFRLPFITGLDPAAPEFTESPESSRLDKTDADFVQVIHTNAGGILDGCVGLTYNSGHVDFFPNGGEHQPGCTIGGSWIDLLTGGCSHAKSHKYWIESINGMPAFVSRPCSDWDTYMTGACNACGQGCLDMGFHVDRRLQGTYFLETNTNPPFAMGDVFPTL
ncbi:Pancreatic lipase-related protein 3 [Portunus trituberculatus]|uniref:Pancreatic lipase-related protein 3 n=1 Tax=Portunus trituberculatus TaxID=210409 RepID=A0A5B7E5M5_PORTR|nr:Pancreatic lipase-related protein 3 [Portunus trituberculatus]